MKRFLNAKLIRRNHRLGRIMVFGGLAMLAGGFIYSLIETDQVMPVLVLAIGGTLAAQFGLALISRWGREPRLDQRLDEALKGLDDRWATLHYTGTVPHLLAGPVGLLALLPEMDVGTISYEDGAWIRDKPARGLLRRGGRSKLGGMPKEANRAETGLHSFLDQHFPESERYQGQPVFVFLSDEAELELDPEGTPHTAVHYKKVKDWLRRQPKGSSPSPDEVRSVAQNLGLEAPEDD